ncbi:MAG: hypothetical protein JXB23_17730 [Candidatus Aminicenantes bacterium]|nr:hypothetical protein [Candidatus Aminicenantes bacterium]
MKPKNPRNVYVTRIEQFDSEIKRIKRIENTLSGVKLALAAAFIAAFYKAATAYATIYLLSLILIAVIFLTAAIIHENFIKKKTFIQTLKTVNEEEIKSLKHDFPDYSPGDSFADPDHAYSSDLDMFGERSIFHFLNRATTGMGCRCLSERLKSLPQANESPKIIETQKAVAELSGMIDLRQQVQAQGKLVEDSQERLEAITDLINERAFILPNRKLIRFMHIMPFSTLGFIGLIAAGLPWPVILIPMIIQHILNRRYREKLTLLYQMSMKNAGILRNYSLIIREIEQGNYTCEVLKKIGDSLHHEGKSASIYIRKISSLVGYLELRRNGLLHPILNTLFLWDLHWTYRLEKWKDTVAAHVPGWFEAIGLFEALSSFACLHFNHPNWTLPELSEADFVFQAGNLGHPLIQDDNRVGNDIDFSGKGKIWIITGPNMSGKSTLLKTIGVNMVLALAGAPVCAAKCLISPFKLYTNLKVSDSLDKNLSLFYAELQRLKMVIDAVSEYERVFFLLDEMLKGTNALDRQAGALALLKQLANSHADGLVATHDLELTKLEEAFPENIRNFHFDGYIEGDKLLFDYKLKQGKCESFNALILMRKMGIDV